MRSGAQLFSYELSLVLAMLIPVAASGDASLRGIVLSQAGGFWDWWIFKLPGAGLVAFLVFVVSSTAELNRGPLDLSEAESELTGGFHTEYSGMGFSLFFLAEYINLFVAAALGATLFLGGFLPPGIEVPAVDNLLALIPGPVWLMAKSFFLIFIYMWLRWSLPRLRVDHLLALEWKGLLPISMANLALASFLVALGWVLP
jgi:NADH-quinone oxidoreductase subunit H